MVCENLSLALGNDLLSAARLWLFLGTRLGVENGRRELGIRDTWLCFWGVPAAGELKGFCPWANWGCEFGGEV